MTDPMKTATTELLSFHQQVADWQLAQLDAAMKQSQAMMDLARLSFVTQRDFAQNLGKSFVEAK